MKEKIRLIFSVGVFSFYSYATKTDRVPDLKDYLNILVGLIVATLASDGGERSSNVARKSFLHRFREVFGVGTESQSSFEKNFLYRKTGKHRY